MKRTNGGSGLPGCECRPRHERDPEAADCATEGQPRTFPSDRGWVYAADIAAVYEGRPVAIIESGPRIHLPLVLTDGRKRCRRSD